MSPLPLVFHKAMRKLVLDLGNLEEPHEKVGAYMSSRVKRRFNAGKTAEGVKWKPLAASTLRSRRAKGIAGIKPLLATGKLKSEVHYKVISQKLGLLSTLTGASKTSVTRISAERIGRRSVKARVHQGYGLGTYISGIPSRPYIGMNKNEQNYVQNVFMKYLTEMIKKNTALVNAMKII